jgi:arylsulfatase A-like enzyme
VIEEIDWSVGEILATLERLELDDDRTLVIFTSDNGPPRWLRGPTGRMFEHHD